MIKRSICIFPKFENIDLIHQIRANYDPLHKLIQPHITLVHSFSSNLSTDELLEHVTNVIRDIQPFKVKLQGFSGTIDRYLFLNVKQGNDWIIELHDKLYEGVLAKYLYKKITYIPHITVGRFEVDYTLDEALKQVQSITDAFNTDVTEITAEIIDVDDQSNIEFTVSL